MLFLTADYFPKFVFFPSQRVSALRIIIFYVEAFFDAYLKPKTIPLTQFFVYDYINVLFWVSLLKGQFSPLHKNFQINCNEKKSNVGFHLSSLKIIKLDYTWIFIFLNFFASC